MIKALLIGGLLFSLSVLSEDSNYYSSNTSQQSEILYWQLEYLKLASELEQVKTYTYEDEPEMAEVIHVGSAPDNDTSITVFYYDNYGDYDYYNLR